MWLLVENDVLVNSLAHNYKFTPGAPSFRVIALWLEVHWSTEILQHGDLAIPVHPCVLQSESPFCQVSPDTTVFVLLKSRLGAFLSTSKDKKHLGRGIIIAKTWKDKTQQSRSELLTCLMSSPYNESQLLLYQWGKMCFCSSFHVPVRLLNVSYCKVVQVPHWWN